MKAKNNELTLPQKNEAELKNSVEQFRLQMQEFTKRLNREPDDESKDATPDGKAQTILISHIEMLLDEYFFGMWETENFKWSVIANEVVGSIDLICTHPVTNQKFRRVGAASVQIMVDAAPKDVNRNQWALNPDNKKPNALDMGFGKLKTECVKNAANSLGKLFGRDLNRKKFDVYRPLINKVQKESERVKLLIEDAETTEQLESLTGHVPNELIDLFNEKMNKLRQNDLHSQAK